MKKYLLVSILIINTLLLIQSCSSTTSPQHEMIYFHLMSNSKYVRVNSQITVYLQLDCKSTEYSTKWSADNGNIETYKDSVIFYAGNSPDTTHIILQLTDESERTFSDTLSLFVYKQIVMLKADDMQYFEDEPAGISQTWLRFIDYVREKGLKANLGLIGNSLVKGNDDYLNFLKNVSQDSDFELWNHGYDHKLNGINADGEVYHEFWNTSFSQQREHLMLTNSLAKSLLGVELIAFGAPGNNIDEATTAAFNSLEEIDIWLFGLPGSNKTLFERTSEIEYPCPNPIYHNFLADYNPETERHVFQIHPNSWDNEDFTEFDTIIEYLKTQQVYFLTFSEYPQSR